MKNFSKIGTAILTFFAVIIVMDGFYVVNETEQAIITQFGNPVDEAITEPGLNFKIPFIQKVNYFEKRYLEWDGDRNQVPTKDKKFIFVDTYARWQITDPLQYFQRLGDERGAQSRIDDILDGETRNAIAANDLVELIRSTNREPISDGIIADIVNDSLETIQTGRDAIQEQIQNLANERAKDLGIAVLDFRFKRINYVEEVRQTVYDRMVSERNRIADKFRSEGQGESSRINGEKEKGITANTIRSIPRGGNHSRSARDLYDFTKSMEAYVSTIDKETSLIISTDSEFYKFLNTIDQ